MAPLTNLILTCRFFQTYRHLRWVSGAPKTWWDSESSVSWGISWTPGVSEVPRNKGPRPSNKTTASDPYCSWHNLARGLARLPVPSARYGAPYTQPAAPARALGLASVGSSAAMGKVYALEPERRCHKCNSGDTSLGSNIVIMEKKSNGA